MRILFINDMYTVGGATKALEELVLLLKEQGHEPIVCTSVYDDFNTFLDSMGIKNITDKHIGVMDVVPKEGRKKLFWFQRKQLKYLLARYRALKIIEHSIDIKAIDIIHTNSIRNDVGCLLYKKYGVPHVMHVREFGQEDFSCMVYMPFYYRYLNQHCSVLLAVSNAVKDSVIKKGVSYRRIHTLYDGVDFSNFVVKSTNTLEDGKLKMVIVGGICELKGQHIAIKALGLLPEEIRKNVTLDIVGWSDPHFLERLKKMIWEMELQAQVRFLGSRDDIAELLCNYHVGLMCSKCEGFGRVTAEYMYAGLGVIAADTGASPELIKDGVMGLIYHRNDPQDLAKKIQQLYSEPILLEIFGKNAHDQAENKYCVQRNFNKIMSTYKALLSASNQK